MTGKVVPKTLCKPPTPGGGAKTIRYSYRSKELHILQEVRSLLPRLQIAFGNDAFVPFR